MQLGGRWGLGAMFALAALALARESRASPDASVDAGDGLPLGAPCTSNDECVNTLNVPIVLPDGGVDEARFCVDGVCCNAPCDGQCNACNVQGAPGQCVVVDGQPIGGRTACVDPDGGVCGAGFCDGLNSWCQFPGDYGDHVSCSDAPPACSADDQSVVRMECNGLGQCAQGKQLCRPYACDPDTSACKTSCASDSDCSNSLFGTVVCNNNQCVSQCALDNNCFAGIPNGDACDMSGGQPRTTVTALFLVGAAVALVRRRRRR